MKVVGEDLPPAHARYLVGRDGQFFTATPCYGMHSPWWVVLTMAGEAEPVPMREGDEWLPIARIHETFARQAV